MIHRHQFKQLILDLPVQAQPKFTACANVNPISDQVLPAAPLDEFAERRPIRLLGTACDMKDKVITHQTARCLHLKQVHALIGNFRERNL